MAFVIGVQNVACLHSVIFSLLTVRKYLTLIIGLREDFNHPKVYAKVYDFEGFHWVIDLWIQPLPQVEVALGGGAQCDILSWSPTPGSHWVLRLQLD